jgi:hypothetical protein
MCFSDKTDWNAYAVSGAVVCAGFGRRGGIGRARRCKCHVDYFEVAVILRAVGPFAPVEF